MRNYEFSAPTVNESTLLGFPTFETDGDKMACSNFSPTGKPHQGSNECKNSKTTSSFSQNFGKELCYSQAPSYNKPSHSIQDEFQADLTVIFEISLIVLFIRYSLELKKAYKIFKLA